MSIEALIENEFDGPMLGGLARAGGFLNESKAAMFQSPEELELRQRLEKHQEVKMKRSRLGSVISNIEHVAQELLKAGVVENGHAALAKAEEFFTASAALRNRLYKEFDERYPTTEPEKN